MDDIVVIERRDQRKRGFVNEPPLMMSGLSQHHEIYYYFRYTVEIASDNWFYVEEKEIISCEGNRFVNVIEELIAI